MIGTLSQKEAGVTWFSYNDRKKMTKKINQKLIGQQKMTNGSSKDNEHFGTLVKKKTAKSPLINCGGIPTE